MSSNHLTQDFGKDASQKQDVRLTKELFVYVKKYPFLFVIIVFLMLAGDVFSILPPYFLKQGLDVSVPNQDLDGLRINAIYLGVFLVLSYIFTISFNYLLTLLGQRLILDIRMNIYKKILSLTNSFFDHTPLGKTLTYLTNDVETLNEFISNGLVAVIGNLIKILFVLSMMFYLNAILASFAFSSVPIFIIATLVFRTSLRNAYRGIRKANSLINTQLVESITGIKEIILFNHKEKSISSFDKENKRYLSSFLKVVKSYSLYFPIIELVSFLSTVGVLYCAHLYTDASNQIKTGEIFAFFFYITMFYRPLRHLSEQLNTFQSAMSASERVFNFLKLTPDFTENKSTSELPPLNNLNEKIKGKITFENVSFSYTPEKEVLKDISFTINPAEKIAIVGATGSGKTTLVSLLTRLYDVNKGKISIDGRDIRDFPLQTLRRNISSLPQDTFLFTGDFIKNIDLLQTKTKEEVIEAAKKSGIHPYIMRLTKQYEQNVLEEGKSLSTGQKQLVAFARAFIHDAPIVVLDEATANIDSESEKLIQDSLKYLIEEKTAIIIAHRLSTIKTADRVLVMHQGRLVEQGSHAELIKKNGIYRKLYEMQSIQSQD